MGKRHIFTDEERAELLVNPYTFRITSTSIVFTLEFKEFVMEHDGKPGMTAEKIFTLAGYRKELLIPGHRRKIIAKIREEAASPDGLTPPTPVKTSAPKKKKHTETEFKELRERIELLEQQVEFLKKSQHLKK